MNLNAKHTALLFLLPFLLTACPSSGGPEQCPNRAASGASICGTISVSSNTFADSDVNDIYAGDYWVANNDANSAQNISNPALVGGYINTAGAGPTGHLQSSGDIADFYKVKLKAGDTVKLYIADAAQNLDLYLYDTNLLEKALSIGITQVESVTAPAAGDFYIKVVAVSAASNYTLTVGITQIATANEYFSNLDFAPGEILVRFQDEKLPLGVMRAEAQSDMVGLQHLSGAPGRVQLLGLGDVAQRQQAAQLLGIQSVPVVGRYADPIVQLKLETMQAVQALRKRSDVLSADLNYHHDLLAVPTDTYYSNQWHYPLIDLPLAWEDLTRGSGAIVAVIDTGIINHPDLAGQLSPDGGYDFISSSSIANDGNGIDSDPTDTGDKVAPKTRSTFHGTHVAGTIAA
ncbi:MAG: S8 family serine peptidase, partial [Gammaproteobacteria bacterium]|nr:S8 family serine peptidase [Gammaproteobacteria bacterium]